MVSHADSTPFLNGLSGKLVTVFSVLVLAVFPLYNDLSYAHITHGKWLALVVITGLLLASTLTLVIVKRVQHRPFHRYWGIPQLLAAAYFLWVALSALMGETSHQIGMLDAPIWWMGMYRYEGLATQLMYFAVFLCLSLVRPDTDTVLTSVAISLTLFFGFVMLQYAGLNPLGLFPEGLSVRTNYEFQGTIGNIDMVSGYLCLMVPLLLCGWVYSHKRHPLWMLAGFLGVLLECLMEVQSGMIVMGCIGLWALVQTASSRTRRCRALGVITLIVLAFALRRFVALPWLDETENLTLRWDEFGFYLMLAVILLATLTLTLPRFLRHHACTPLSAVVTVCIVLLALGCILSFVDMPESLGGIYEISEVLHSRPQESFGSYRLGIWQHTLAMAQEHLAFGSGPDSFYLDMAAELSASGASYPEAFDSAHNEYLTLLTNNGLPALIFYLSLLGYALIGGIRYAKYSKLCACGALAVGCYAIQAFFSFSICIVSPMFWAILALLCVSITATARDRKEMDSDE